MSRSFVRAKLDRPSCAVQPVSFGRTRPLNSDSAIQLASAASTSHSLDLASDEMAAQLHCHPCGQLFATLLGSPLHPPSTSTPTHAHARTRSKLHLLAPIRSAQPRCNCNSAQLDQNPQTSAGIRWSCEIVATRVRARSALCMFICDGARMERGESARPDDAALNAQRLGKGKRNREKRKRRRKVD